MSVGKFTITGVFADHADQPLPNVEVRIDPLPSTSVDTTPGGKVYLQSLISTTDDQGRLEDADGFGLVTFPGLRYRISAPRVGLEPRTFDAPADGATLDLRQIPFGVPAPDPTTAEQVLAAFAELRGDLDDVAASVPLAASDAEATAGTNTTKWMSPARVKTVLDAAVTALRGGVASAGDTLAKLHTLISNHAADTSNPHAVTKAQVGLGNVDNTPDASKPVSTAQAAADNAARDAAKAASVPIAGGTMTGLLTLFGDPTNSLHAATRQWVLAQNDALKTALVGGAPAELDTFVEAFTRFTADEGALTALAGVVAGKQPADDDLTAIAGLATQPLGRSLLTALDHPALVTLLAITKTDVGLGNVSNLSPTGLAADPSHTGAFEAKGRSVAMAIALGGN